jgi:hypothetical protein
VVLQQRIMSEDMGARWRGEHEGLGIGRQAIG